MATAVPSCDAMAEQLSILCFMKKNTAGNFINKMYEEWLEVLKHNQINEKVRNQFDTWFLKCYKLRNDVSRLNDEVSSSMAQDQVTQLYDEFETSANNELTNNMNGQFCLKIGLKIAIKDIKDNYSPEGWVKEAVNCVRKEQQLIRKYTKVKTEIIDEEKCRKIEAGMDDVEDLRKTVNEVIQRIENDLKEVDKLQNFNGDEEQRLKEMHELCSAQKDKKKNGKIMKMDRKITESNEKIRKAQENMQKCLIRVYNSQQCLWKDLGELRNLLDSLIKNLKTEVQEWQKQFKYEYAEIAASPNLDRIAPWCAKTGKLLHEFLNDELMKLSNITTESEEEQNKVVFQQFRQLFEDFCQSTFVVTEQETYIVKVDKKYLPKVTVRILAADYLGSSLRSSDITAYFFMEDKINECYHDNKFDVQALNNADYQLKANKVKFTPGKKKEKYEGMFSKLQFSEPFERRGNRDRQSHVHEDKYRIVFTAEIDRELYWTLSLPLVVTTGANQGCCALASVMWQCYSTDVHAMPLKKKSSLPWCEVAQMLKEKMAKLCNKRTLSEENLAHLKRRLLGAGEFDDDHLVSLNRFCFDKMDRSDKEELCSFSFWKWFLGNYNLLEKYLLDYWKDGLIEGFIDKDCAEKKLKTCPTHRSGMFILRFSDNNILDSQGIKSVFGMITSIVMVIKEENGAKVKKITPLQLAGHKLLKDKNLANILMETLDKNKQGNVYRLLYPGNKSREETFDTYCKNSAIVDGYEGVRDAFIVDLDQAMSTLSVSTGKHRSNSIDSGISSPAAQQCTVAAPVSQPCAVGAGKKKARRSLADNHPEMGNLLATKSSCSYTASVNESPSHQSDIFSYTTSPNPSLYSPIPSDNEASQAMPIVAMTAGGLQNNVSTSTISPCQLDAIGCTRGNRCPGSSSPMNISPMFTTNAQLAVSNIPTVVESQNFDFSSDVPPASSPEVLICSLMQSPPLPTNRSAHALVSDVHRQHSPSPADRVEICFQESNQTMPVNTGSANNSPQYAYDNSYHTQQPTAEFQIQHQLLNSNQSLSTNQTGQTDTSQLLQELVDHLQEQKSAGQTQDLNNVLLLLQHNGFPPDGMSNVLSQPINQDLLMDYQASPPHPEVEMDNTPSDMIMNSGGDFNFNTNAIPDSDLIDSGSINTAEFNRVCDEQLY